MLDATAKATVDGLNGTTSSKREVTVNGFAARETIASVPDVSGETGTMYSRVVVNGPRVYQAIAVMRGVSSERARKFLDSFAIAAN